MEEVAGLADPADIALVNRLAEAGDKIRAGWVDSGGATRHIFFKFSKKNGALAGDFLGPIAFTDVGAAAAGPLRFVSVKGGVVQFTTPVGANYTLRLQPDGCLRGKIVLAPHPPRDVWICFP
jgi:hypothetical protein